MDSPKQPGPEALLGVPNATSNEVPGSLCLVAEDVVAGLEIVVKSLREVAPTVTAGAQRIEYERRLKAAGEYLVKYFEDLYKVSCVPLLDIKGQQKLSVDRLGVLPDGDYALYDSQARLRPGARFPINYGGYHTVPIHNAERDTLPGSLDSRQLYIGYGPSDLSNMSGYALSWNRFRNLFSAGTISLEAIPTEEATQLELEGVVVGDLARFIRR